jgi:hypothetical protein
MLALICAYLCIPVRFRFIARWFAAAFVLVVVVLVLILFSRILLTLPKHHNPPVPTKSHQPIPSDLVRRHPGFSVTLRSVRED